MWADFNFPTQLGKFNLN